MADALAAGDGVILDELSARIKELEAQRDELLEALEMMLEMSEMSGFGKAAAEDVARAAIAKAKGGSSIRGTSVNLILLDEFAEEAITVLEEQEIQTMREQRDELLEALGWYAYVTEDANRYGITRDLAQAELRADRGKRAKEAIAKVRENE